MSGPIAAAPVVIAAGGTAGHFFPAEALGTELAARGHALVLMTDRRAGVRVAGVFKDRPQYVIAGRGVAGRGTAAKLRGLASVARGTWQARQILSEVRAAAVIGFGGYPSVAPLLAARLLGRDRPAMLLHEGNAVLGQANARLARFADAIAVSFADTGRLAGNLTDLGRVSLTGMPVRDEIASLAASPYPPTGQSLSLLVWGGSLGARIFSDIVPAVLAGLAPELRARLRVTQQARAEDVARVRAAYDEAGIAAEVAPFLDDVAARLAAAHLVIGRAGGSSVAELAAIGRPAILVPLPIAASDEQSANARALVARGGAWMFRQAQFTPAALDRLLRELFASPARLAAAAQAAASLGGLDATGRLADLVERHLHRTTAAALKPRRDTEQHA